MCAKTKQLIKWQLDMNGMESNKPMCHNIFSPFVFVSIDETKWTNNWLTIAIGFWPARTLTELFVHLITVFLCLSLRPRYCSPNSVHCAPVIALTLSKHIPILRNITCTCIKWNCAAHQQYWYKHFSSISYSDKSLNNEIGCVRSRSTQTFLWIIQSAQSNAIGLNYRLQTQIYSICKYLLLFCQVCAKNICHP